MTRPIRDLDVPLPELERQMAEVVASLDPFDRMACEHPEACSCETDYPNWTPGGTS